MTVSKSTALMVEIQKICGDSTHPLFEHVACPHHRWRAMRPHYRPGGHLVLICPICGLRRVVPRELMEALQ